jgi:hypothetical protein
MDYQGTIFKYVLSFFVLPLISLTLFSLPSRADDVLDRQMKALAAITSAANEICSTVAMEGSSQNTQLSGDVKAKLDGLISKLADLGVEGSGQFTSTQYKGVLQQDLASTLKSNEDCKQNVLKMLQEKMIPSLAPSGPSKSETQQNLIDALSADTPIAKLSEVFGQPIAQTKFKLTKVSNGKKTEVSVNLRRFQGAQEDLFVVGDSPLEGAAVFAAENATEPVVMPYYHPADVDAKGVAHDISLTNITVGDLQNSCLGNIQSVDARFLYIVSPICYFGRGGGYKSYQFSFIASDQMSACGGDIFDLAGTDFGANDCKQFLALTPNFVSVYFGDDDPDALLPQITVEVLNFIYWRN